MSNKPIGRNPDVRRDISGKNTSGWATEKVDRRDLNQAVFQSITDLIWGTEDQVKVSNNADFYTDGSGDPFDLNDVAVTINEDDKILIAHDVTQTANLLLDAGGKKITLEMLQGVTLDMDTFDLTLGGTGDSIGGDIRVIGTGVGTLTVEKSDGLRVNHTTMIINNLAGDIIDNNSVASSVEFETSKDLVGNFISSTQARATFSRMSLINKTDFTPKYLNNKTLTWTMPGDLESGQSEQAVTDYGCWVDSDENLRLVADVESITDGVTAGFLDDSANTAATQLWKAGDIVYNLDDKTKTTIKTTPTIDGNDVELNDDIFLASPKNYKIVKMSPEGLGENRERLQTVHNNSGSDIDDQWYEQDQGPKDYSEEDTDFDITETDWTTEDARATYTQVRKWAGGVEHYIDAIASGTFSTAPGTKTMVMSGIISAPFYQPIRASQATTATRAMTAYLAPNSANFVIRFDSSVSAGNEWMFGGLFRLTKKPPFAK